MKLWKKEKPAPNTDPRYWLRVIVWSAAILLSATIAVAYSWRSVLESYAPMTSTHSRCLICGRGLSHRRSDYGGNTKHVIPGECSPWIDSFVPAEHDHFWVGSTTTHREHWFGGTWIACGKSGALGVLPEIFRQRDALGEQNARDLVLKYHALIKDPNHAADRFKQLDAFYDALRDDPHSLLKSDSSEIRTSRDD